MAEAQDRQPHARDPAGQAVLADCCSAIWPFSTSSTRRSSTSRCRRSGTDLRVSVQEPAVGAVSGYLLTYGGFMLLGGRAADLARPAPVARRRAPSLFALARSLAGWAGTERRGPRRRAARARARRRADAPRRAVHPDDHVQSSRSDRAQGPRRLGRRWPAWPRPRACCSAACSSKDPGWRWVFFVNPIACCRRPCYPGTCS